MSTEGQSVGRSGEHAPVSPFLAELKSQCERLHQVVRELEEEKKRDAEALAAAQAELSEYRRLVYDWAREHVREEDWANFSKEQHAIPAEDVVAELERQDGP